MFSWIIYKYLVKKCPSRWEIRKRRSALIVEWGVLRTDPPLLWGETHTTRIYKEQKLMNRCNLTLWIYISFHLTLNCSAYLRNRVSSSAVKPMSARLASLRSSRSIASSSESIPKSTNLFLKMTYSIKEKHWRQKTHRKSKVTWRISVRVSEW